MALERQTSWGKLTAAALFLEGVCGGTFLVAFLLDLLKIYEPVVRIGLLVGPGLGIIAGIILFSKLGIRGNGWRVVLNLSSWMARGALSLGLVIVFGLGYAIPSLWLPWNETVGGIIVGVIAAIGSLILMLYGGLVLGAAKPIPTWNSSTLPLLSLFTSLLGGMGILFLLSPVLGTVQIVNFLHVLGRAGIILIILELLALWGYIEVGLRGSISSANSLGLTLKMPSFLAGALIVGLGLPLALLIWGIFIADGALVIILPIIVGLLLAIGGLYLRYTVLKAGMYIALYPV